MTLIEVGVIKKIMDTKSISFELMSSLTHLCVKAAHPEIEVAW